MKKFNLLISMMIITFSVDAAVYWTVKAQGGVMTTASGASAINIGSYQPTGANPAGTIWEPCYQNWIYMDKRSNGDAIDEKLVDRMYSTALAAYKTDSRIRVAIDRSESGRCYTNQIYDQGN